MGNTQIELLMKKMDYNIHKNSGSASLEYLEMEKVEIERLERALGER